MSSNKNGEEMEIVSSNRENGNSRPIKFRNYTPSDSELQKLRVSNATVSNVAKEITEKLAKVASQEPDLSVLTVAAKKPNWDLKRDISNKLAKLELRTQHAIVELMREKLMKEAHNSEDLNQGVSLSIAKDVEDSDSEND